MREPLCREEVAKAIEHRSPARVPMVIHAWNASAQYAERAAEVEAIQAQYPCDVAFVGPRMPRVWDDPDDPKCIPGYSWMGMPPPKDWNASTGHDARVAIEDWDQLDALLARWPDPNHPGAFAGQKERLARERKGRYACVSWTYLLYERLWGLRGMSNVLCDFYDHPEAVHRLLDALTEFYIAIIVRAGKELNADAIFVTDDLGMQTGPMFSHAIFTEFFKSRYQSIFRAAHDQGMHFWLHTCGDIRLFMGDFTEIGLDVIHPIQKHAMDEREIAQRYGGKICFWAGVDVQQILPHGTPEDVRREVRFLIDAYDRPEGGCMITAGNGITPDVPLENLRAFYDEAWTYGIEHRRGGRGA